MATIHHQPDDYPLFIQHSCGKWPMVMFYSYMYQRVPRVPLTNLRLPSTNGSLKTTGRSLYCSESAKASSGFAQLKTLTRKVHPSLLVGAVFLKVHSWQSSYWVDGK